MAGDDKDAKAETKEDPNAKDDPNAGKAQGKQGAIGFTGSSNINPEEQRCCTMWA